jgi:hypothetical protein
VAGATTVSKKQRRRDVRPVKGYANRAQRYSNQQGLQACLAKVERELAYKHVHVVEGGRAHSAGPLHNRMKILVSHRV